MKDLFYFVLAISILGIMGFVGYYLHNKMELDNFEFLQRQTDKCREKYKDELKDEGYTWYDGPDDYKHITVDIIYSEQAKACLKREEYERVDKQDNYKNDAYSIENLDKGIYYFNCIEDGDEEYARCMVGCENKRPDSCLVGMPYSSGDISNVSDIDFSSALLESPYYSKLYKYGFLNDEQIKGLVDFLKDISEMEDE